MQIKKGRWQWDKLILVPQRNKEVLELEVKLLERKFKFIIYLYLSFYNMLEQMHIRRLQTLKGCRSQDDIEKHSESSLFMCWKSRGAHKLQWSSQLIASKYHGNLYWDLSCSTYLSYVKRETKATTEQLKFAKILTTLKNKSKTIC